MMRIFAAGLLTIALSACGGTSPSGEGDALPVGEEAVFVFPESVAAFGDGYPNNGDPCRKLGESDATSKYLDDSAWLAGCPTRDDAEQLGGTIVDTIDGITVVSIPMGDANAGMEYEDALVEGTDYHATTQIACGFGGAAPTGSCDAGVKRNWGNDGANLVEVVKPDGHKRALFFTGTTPTGADSAQADGSAGWDFDYTRNGDQVTIKFGPETYVVIDALIEGG